MLTAAVPASDPLRYSESVRFTPSRTATRYSSLPLVSVPPMIGPCSLLLNDLMRSRVSLGPDLGVRKKLLLVSRPKSKMRSQPPPVGSNVPHSSMLTLLPAVVGSTEGRRT